MAWTRDANRDAPLRPHRGAAGADVGAGPDTAQRRLESIRAGVLLERERELRANALDAYESLDEASERLIAAIVRLVEARAAWTRMYEAARSSAGRHATAADRVQVGRLGPPQHAPWPTEEEYPAIWNLLQPEARVDDIDPEQVKAELRSWAMGWYSKREQQRAQRLCALDVDSLSADRPRPLVTPLREEGSRDGGTGHRSHPRSLAGPAPGQGAEDPGRGPGAVSESGDVLDGTWLVLEPGGGRDGMQEGAPGDSQLELAAANVASPAPVRESSDAPSLV